MPDTQFLRDASGRLTLEMFRIPADRYPEICGAIAAKFGLSPDMPFVTNGMDLLFQEYRCGEQTIELAWDNWMGFTVTAKDPTSEPLVQSIGVWLQQTIWATKG